MSDDNVDSARKEEQHPFAAFVEREITSTEGRLYSFDFIIQNINPNTILRLVDLYVAGIPNVTTKVSVDTGFEYKECLESLLEEIETWKKDGYSVEPITRTEYCETCIPKPILDKVRKLFNK